MATFEDLLNGRELHTLEDDEINDIIAKLSPEELDKANAKVRRVRRSPSPSARTVKSKAKREDAVKALLMKGMKQNAT